MFELLCATEIKSSASAIQSTVGRPDKTGSWRSCELAKQLMNTPARRSLQTSPSLKSSLRLLFSMLQCEVLRRNGLFTVNYRYWFAKENSVKSSRRLQFKKAKSETSLSVGGTTDPEQCILLKKLTDSGIK